MMNKEMKKMERPFEEKSYYEEFQYCKKANEFFVIILMDVVKKLFNLGLKEEDIYELLPFSKTGIQNILNGKAKEVGSELLQFAILCGNNSLKEIEVDLTSSTLH